MRSVAHAPRARPPAPPKHSTLALCDTHSVCTSYAQWYNFILVRCDALPLFDGGLDVVVGADEASTGGGTIVGSELGTSLGAGGAVDEFVILPAAGDIAGALENAGLHVGFATLSLDAHAAAVHVDFAGNVKGAVLAIEGVFAPSLGDLTVDHSGVGVDGSPGAGSARGEGNVEGLLVTERVGDERSVNVDPGSSGTPDNESDVLARVVDELAGVVTTSADPGFATGGGRVGVRTSEDTKNLEDVADDVGDKATLLNLRNGNSVADGSQAEKSDSRDERKHVCGWQVMDK